MSDILDKLGKVLEERKAESPDNSYVARLYNGGNDAILEKIGEEAMELILAANGNSRDEIIHETADLWFHSLVLLAHQGITPEEVTRELERRFGKSGLTEKAERSK